MKKLFVLALAFAAFASCNKVESIETASEHISFGNAFVEVKTRDAVDPSTTTDSITAFDAWAIMDAPTGTVLDAERVTRNGDEWTYQNLQYWLADHDYYFYAVAPVDDTNVTVDASGINETGLGVINFVNENGTCDLLYAEKHVETPEVMGTMPKVHLQFAHLLAKLKFTLSIISNIPPLFPWRFCRRHFGLICFTQWLEFPLLRFLPKRNRTDYASGQPVRNKQCSLP